jgi:hypothetical protein
MRMTEGVRDMEVAKIAERKTIRSDLSVLDTWINR